MGVPAFFRWLSEKFPKTIVDMVEKRIPVVDGVGIPLDLTKGNPNGVEYDNLYVDMNGLIHPCSHPEDREAPKTEGEMYMNITKYVDRLFACIRPRRLMFLAIDGVAPRAKMNQQRSRRFRAAREASDKAKMMQEILLEMQEMGLDAPEGHMGEWDSNVITPGTNFMTKLSLYLWYYVLDRMNRNPAWRNIKVIISDASEPGEGEHKIMNFVRSERSNEGYDPNQRHVLHGLDADLIMLALATHEVHFNILREQVLFGKQNRMAGTVSEAQRLLDAQTGKEGTLASCLDPDDEWVYKKPLVMVKIGVLRDYLELEFRYLKDSVPFQFDFERVVDDFIFLCFFVGNDFLPHLPSLDIRDGAIDFLLELYISLLPSLGDYLTRSGGNLNLSQVDVLLARVGEIEDVVFQRRKAAEIDQANRDRARDENEKRNGSGRGPQGAKLTQIQSNALHKFAPVTEGMTALGGGRGRAPPPPPPPPPPKTNQEAAEKMKSLLGKGKGAKKGKKRANEEEEEVEEEGEPAKKKKRANKGEDEEEDAGDGVELAGTGGGEVKPVVTQRKQLSTQEAKEAVEARMKQIKDAKIDEHKATVQDPIRLHEVGWKKRYYEDTYKKEDIANNGGLKHMCVTYVQGLCWVLKYYYQGCPSWNWYYPFHYAPFASDLVNIDEYPIDFEMAAPFRPVEQLLAVLPKESAHALPEPARWLMTDSESPIAKLYDGDVPLDPNGKVLPWLWVLLLPFVDESDIQDAYKGVRKEFSLEERRNNEWGKPLIFVHSEHSLAKELVERLGDQAAEEEDEEVREALTLRGTPTKPESAAFTSEQGQGISGTCLAPPPRYHAKVEDTLSPPSTNVGDFESVMYNRVHCWTFAFPEEREHKSVLLRGAKPDQCTITVHDSVGVPRFTRNNRNNIVDLAQKFYKDQGGHGQNGGRGYSGGQGQARYGPGGGGGGGRGNGHHGNGNGGRDHGGRGGHHHYQQGQGGYHGGGYVQQQQSFQSQHSYQHFNPHAQPLPPQAAFQQQQQAHGSFFQSSGGGTAPYAPPSQKYQQQQSSRFSFASGAPGRGGGASRPRSVPPQLAQQLQGHMQQFQQGVGVGGGGAANYGAMYGGPPPPPTMQVPQGGATMASMRDALAKTLKKQNN